MAGLRVAVVHLSDIHLKAENRAVLTRIDALNESIRSEVADCEALVLVISGDLAFSGTTVEYDLAKSLIEGLLNAFRKWVNRVECVIIPGNHDCDFRTESRLRPIVLNKIDDLLDEIETDKHDAAVECLGVQDSFFKFAIPYLTSTSGDRLHYHSIHEFGSRIRVRFECFNTAWVSQLGESQGQIRIPPKVATRLRIDAATPSDFIVTVLHHPYSWFEPTNRRRIQTEIERNSDLILTGHEHVADQYYRINPGTTTVQYVEGAVLQGDGPGSSFNIIKLDFDAQQQELLRLELRSHSYTVAHRTGPNALKTNSGAFSRRFIANDEFSSDLNNPGRGIKHPRSRDLSLRDLFLYPDLRPRMFEKRLRGEKVGPPTVSSENVIYYLLNAKRTLILGPTECGKTAFARILYSDLQVVNQLAPVLINAQDITGYTQDALRRAIDRAVAKQYSPAVKDEYFQLPIDRKVLIIDNFEEFQYNSKAQARLIREAESHFNVIIVLADDLFRFEELSEEGRESNPFIGFEHLDIRPLGFRLRRQLIRKWVLLGQEYRITELEVFQEVERRERVIDSIIRADLIPPYTPLILLILQAGEVDPNQAVNSGTYGYLNNFLIMRALANISKQITDIGTITAYLSNLAYAQFSADVEQFSRSDFDVITTRYIDEYGLTLNSDGLLADLTAAQILVQTNGSIAFRHAHYYFYFVAKFFSDKIENKRSGIGDQLRAQLREIADNIYFEPYVSILTFYLYFRKDEELIEYLLRNSKEIYAEYTPCNLESHVEFLNELYEKKPNRSLPDPRPEERRDEILRDMDEDGPSYSPRPSKLKYSKELRDYLKINIALKTMQVLGQVLKDSPGELPAKLKADIAEECYSIGLRTLRAVFLVAESNLEAFQAAIEDLMKERRAYDPEARGPKDVKQFLIWLCLGAATGIIRRISRAVGHTQLERTYQDVLKRFEGMLSAELIDLSIKMDQFHQLTLPMVEDMVEHRLKKNIFGYQIVQEFVYGYFTLFPSERAERQGICAAVGILPENPRFFEARLKKLPSVSGTIKRVKKKKSVMRRR